MTLVKGANQTNRTRLLAASDSFYSYGLIFQSVAVVDFDQHYNHRFDFFWFPFVHRITKSLGQMTKVTDQIAEENFDILTNENRADELGRLGSAINHLAGRLSGFVHGQKRFSGIVRTN